MKIRSRARCTPRTSQSPFLGGRVVNQLQRQNTMVEHLDAVGACSYQDLATLLNVSEMTVRRDVDKLLQRGKLIKNLGGAQTIHAPRHFYESGVQQRLPIHRLEKNQIAREALRRIQPRRRSSWTAARPASFWPDTWPRSFRG